MNSKVVKILGLSCLSFFGLHATASDLSEVYELSVNNDPQLGAAKALYMARREVIPQARSGLLPAISVSGNTTDVRRTLAAATPQIIQNFNENSWQAALQQPLFRLENWYTFQQSKNLEAQAMAQFAADQQELIFRVSDSYFTILEANDALSASNAERDAVGRQLEQVQQRFDVGLVAITDVLEATAQYDSSTVNVIESEGLQVTSFESLLRLTGQRYNQVDGLADNFPVSYPEPNNEEAWVQRALEGNYSLISAAEAVKAAQQNLSSKKSRHLPTLDAQLAYAESNSGGPNFLGSAIEQGSARLVLNVPVYTGGAVRSQAKQAGYELEQAQQTFDLTQRQVVETTRNLFTAINTDVARVKARLKGIESSQSALEATQTGYEVGTRNIVDVLVAQQRLYLAQFQYASARYQYIRDTLNLKQTVGSLSPDDIYGLNNYIVENKPISRITPAVR